MPVIIVTSDPPYGRIHVNTDMIYAVVPDVTKPGTRLLIDAAGGRGVSANEDIDAIAALAGPSAFVLFRQASLKPGPALVNKVGWVSISPHPQVANVSQINFKNQYIAVKGSVDAVAQALSA
ncbi:hypothetical protein [Xanthobacter versatilis]|uniref:hypothetical protein n=1 Tax=Xanthobacter autotrophicus (strain ATCC BAA-1158 / Py2) TaxID=78245 RepID=UPI0037295DD8